MAENEKNTPIQDPENLENRIPESTAPEEIEAPVTDEPVAEEPVAEEPVAEKLVEETPTEEFSEEAPVEEAKEEAPSTEEEKPLAVDEASETPLTEEPVAEEPIAEEPVTEDAPVEVTSSEEETSSEEGADEIFEIKIDGEGKIYLNKPDDDKSEEEDEKKSEPKADFHEEEVEVDPEDLVIYDDVVDAIKAEGARLQNDELSLYSYVKHSKEAIRNFESAVKAGQRSVDANRDEREAPRLLAGVIKICGSLLEIKCNNLENFVRVKAYDYIKEAKTSLHQEIERYNGLVITYSSLTGEQLTRLSTFLPENIASGKSLAVVPKLIYAEKYVQLLPDEKMSRDEEATIMPIIPALSTQDMLDGVKSPTTNLGCWFYSGKIKRRSKKLDAKGREINKQISKLKVSRGKYESELQSLEARTPLADQTTEDYKNKVFAIRIKYGKKLAGISTVKTQNAFARTRLSLIVSRMALEREKLVLAYESMRETYRAGTHSQRKSAERAFSKAITSYNQCAEVTSKATGTNFDKLPLSIIEQACRGPKIVFPIVAYKRELVEIVGDNVRRIGMTVLEDVVPDEQGYSENTGKILSKHSKIHNTASLSTESAVVDRASAIARVMIESLKDSADLVLTADELEQFEIKSRKAIKYFKRSRRMTERAIAKAFDENGVVTALIENLRVISNLIEVRRICVAVNARLKKVDAARSHGRALYKLIELYNGRAIDYVSIVGEQFSRITLATSKELVDSAKKLKVPTITYKDNYIEVFPKDPLKDKTYEKPRLWRAGIYTPLMMHHFRLTENRAVETTVINSPFVFDVMTDDLPAVSWYHPIGFIQHLAVGLQPFFAWCHRMTINAEIWFVDESLLISKSGLKGRQNKNDRKQKKYERKLKRLNDERDASILALETVVHESDRKSAAYQKKLYNINTKFSRKVYNLKLRYSKDCIGRNEARLMLEHLVLERERLAGINKVLLKYRSYGRVTFLPNVLVKYKKKFIDAITEHNKTAEKLSEMIGVNFSQVSTSVADEIIRYGRMIKFPEIVCCREVIETIDGQNRTVGDKWHGYGLYTGTSGSAKVNGQAPVMSVGAMGYATDMGVPFLKADFDGMTMIGMTPGGVPLIGFSQTGETSIPFTGTPMMLSGTDDSVVLDAGKGGQDSLILGAANVTDPYSGINSRGIDSNYSDDVEEDAKDLHSGCETETPLDLEAKMIYERFGRALRARSMTSIDNVANWWKLLGSEINVRLMRWLILRPKGFLRYILPRDDFYLEPVNRKVNKLDVQSLRLIARVGGIIDIECKRLYSATKTGIRRSQRVWSAWLHEDIQFYNDLVKEYNSNHERHMHIELLSLTIPDTIIFRKTDRPPTPPIFSMRNRVKLDENGGTIMTDQIYDKLVDYAIHGATKHTNFLVELWNKLISIPRIKFHYKHGHRKKVLSLVTAKIMRRYKRTYLYRQSNEARHYRIRYEKAESMRRYNRQTLRAVGVAGDPIKYQSKVHKALRKYLSRNFRIDYNMRIYQIIVRALRIDPSLYWTVTIAFAVIIAAVGLMFQSKPAFQVVLSVGIVWAALPLIFLALKIIVGLVCLAISTVLFITKYLWYVTYGARDVERNRYGAILECFVSEQYKLLIACEKLVQKPRSGRAKKFLISTVNDYNKRVEIYSEKLRVPIRTVETTALIDKLMAPDAQPLTELQNFVYVRELVERVDDHQVGKKLDDRELGNLVAEINDVINSINLAGADNQVAVDFLEGAMQRLISYIQTDIKPTQNERFELKRDLIQAISQFDIGAGRKELFSKNVIAVVDQLGGRDRRRIISVLAKDDMII